MLRSTTILSFPRKSFLLSLLLCLLLSKRAQTERDERERERESSIADMNDLLVTDEQVALRRENVNVFLLKFAHTRVILLCSIDINMTTTTTRRRKQKRSSSSSLHSSSSSSAPSSSSSPSRRAMMTLLLLLFGTISDVFVVRATWPIVRYKNGTVGVKNDGGTVKVQSTDLIVDGNLSVSGSLFIQDRDLAEYEDRVSFLETALGISELGDGTSASFDCESIIMDGPTSLQDDWECVPIGGDCSFDASTQEWVLTNGGVLRSKEEYAILANGEISVQATSKTSNCYDYLIIILYSNFDSGSVLLTVGGEFFGGTYGGMGGQPYNQFRGNERCFGKSLFSAKAKVNSCNPTEPEVHNFTHRIGTNMLELSSWFVSTPETVDAYQLEEEVLCAQTAHIHLVNRDLGNPVRRISEIRVKGERQSASACNASTTTSVVSQLQSLTPPKCMRPSGTGLFFNGTSWICECVQNSTHVYHGESCENTCIQNATQIWNTTTSSCQEIVTQVTDSVTIVTDLNCATVDGLGTYETIGGKSIYVCNGYALLLAYNHAANAEVVAVGYSTGVAPTSPVSSNAHIVADMINKSIDDIESVKFFCNTTNHERIMNFRTENDKIRSAMVDGVYNPGCSNSCTSAGPDLSTGYTLLEGHTTRLPATTTRLHNTATSRNDFGIYFPMWNGGTCGHCPPSYGWHIGAYRGTGVDPITDFQCDSESIGETDATSHQIWVKFKQ